MKKLIKAFNAFELLVSKILLVVIIVLVFYAAVARSIGYPVPWSVDLAQTFYAWFAFIAASIALKNKSHIGVDILSRKFPKKVQIILEIIGIVLSIGFLAIITYYGVQLSIKNYTRLMNSMNISYSVITISVAYGCFSMLLTSIVHLKDNIKLLLKDTDEIEIQKRKSCVGDRLQATEANLEM